MSSFNAYHNSICTVSQVVRQHLPSIEWLVSTSDGDRRTGRSTALALAFLRDSFSSSLSSTKVFDHFISSGRDSFQGMRQTIQGMYPGVFIDRDGRIEPQPHYPGDSRSPQFQNTLDNVRSDFRDVCRSASRLGVSPEWMMNQVRAAIAESVMST